MRPRGDHFYTTSSSERSKAISNFGYVDEQIACWVYDADKPGTDSLFRLYNASIGDHFYTTDPAERDTAKTKYGYTEEPVACWVPKVEPPPGTVGLFRLYNGNTGDHFYTTDEAEREKAKSTFGYVDEGVACWVPVAGNAQLFRLYNSSTGDHFYTTDPAERDAAKKKYGYTEELVACRVYTSAATNRIPFFRLYNPVTSDHFYTTDPAEREDTEKKYGYKDEQIACWVVAPTVVPDLATLFRLYNPGNGDHFYTTDAAERDSALAGGYVHEGIACVVFSVDGSGRKPLFRLYKRYGAMVRLVLKVVQEYKVEGVACQVYPAPGSNLLPFFRLYNPESGDHFYTTDPAERDSASNNGYVQEGTACWVAKDKSRETSDMFRLYNPVTGDHFYTTSASERIVATILHGYKFESVACFVPDTTAQTVPFFRLYNSATGDHFYTKDPQERDQAVANTGPAVGIPAMVASMQQVYDNVGIRVAAVSTEFVSLPESVTVLVGYCIQSWPFGTTDEQDELFQHRENAAPLDIVVYFVSNLIPPAFGCATHPENSPGAIVTANATQWTLAHEVGHVLGLGHVNDNDRLMTGNSTGKITNPPPDLTDDEAGDMDESQYTIDI